MVLLSGGVDSTTALAIARSEGFACHCLSFDYGQRHRRELKAAITRALRFMGTEPAATEPVAVAAVASAAAPEPVRQV